MRFLTTKAQLKAANSPIGNGLSIESIQSYIDEVETELCPIIGEATVAQFGIESVEIKLFRTAIANLALANYTSSGAVLIDDSGISVLKSPTKAPASDKKLIAFKIDALNRGWKAFYALINHLDANPTTFTIWKDSNERKLFHCSLFSSASEFSAFGGLNISDSLFHRLKTLIRRVEDDVLNPNFGESIVEDLRAKRLSGSIVPNLLKLERKFLRIIGPLAMVEAIPLQIISIQDSGVFQLSKVALGNASDNIESFAAAEQNRLSMLLGKLETEGNGFLKQTKDWISQNISDYPLYTVQLGISREALNTSDSNIYLL